MCRSGARETDDGSVVAYETATTARDVLSTAKTLWSRQRLMPLVSSFFSGSWTLFVDAEKTTRSPPTCWNHFVVCLCVGFFYYHFIGSVVWEKERKKEGNFVTLPAFWSESRDGCCCWTVAAHSNNGRDPIRPPLKTNTGQGVRAALFILNRELKIGQRMPLFTTGEKCRIL